MLLGPGIAIGGYNSERAGPIQNHRQYLPLEPLGPLENIVCII
jgi:hypothetical protein